MSDVPESWLSYQDRLLQEAVRMKRPKGVPARIFRYLLVDVQNGKTEILHGRTSCRVFAERLPISGGEVIGGIRKGLRRGDPAGEASSK